MLWALGSFVLGFAQTEDNPVKWSYSANPLEDNQYELNFSAQIFKSWHVYALKVSDNPDFIGPIPTSIRLNPDAKNYTINTSIKDGKYITHFDPNFDADLNYYEKTISFKQIIKVKSEKPFILKGVLEYMACNDSKCIFPDPINFEIKINAANSENTLDQSLESIIDTTDKKVVVSKVNDPFNWNLDPTQPLDNCEIEVQEETMWLTFLQGLFWGLFALLTPCVFPMIPLTVAFFTKSAGSGSGKSKAVLYGLFILLTYVAVSIPFHIVSSTNPAMFNEFATNPGMNLAFFAIFIVFAVSFFGYYEITLPNSWANKMDSNASKIGGILGVFFMAITLVIVSFSCTGPILGGMLGQIYASNAQGTVEFLGLTLSLAPTKLTAATAGFGIALGLPFGLFAFFPSLMKSLPRSGGWLEDFKVSLGFLEVALAIKFVSNADLVQQWGFLKRETFFALWIIVGTMWTLYLLGKFKFKPNQGSQKLSQTKLFFAIVIGLFTLRIIPGVFPPSHLNEFRFLSGFPPPSSYSFYPHEEEFKVYKDLKEAMAVAKMENKPLFVDFTGWACVNCRKMEETVWVDEEIKQILKDKYIMVSLYVDEKIELPKDQQFVYKSGNLVREIKTVGNKWATLQAETFNNQAQPFYVVLSPDSTLLIPSEDYNPNVKEYAKWLNCGVNAFDTWKSSNAAKQP